ncbi:hypothetical protein J6590_064714 [Homalodisca vitripennis]|nr:hypothetical protein J6590_064714 [Homalodisca vitripennis]
MYFVACGAVPDDAEPGVFQRVRRRSAMRVPCAICAQLPVVRLLEGGRPPVISVTTTSPSSSFLASCHLCNRNGRVKEVSPSRIGLIGIYHLLVTTLQYSYCAGPGSTRNNRLVSRVGGGGDCGSGSLQHYRLL